MRNANKCPKILYYAINGEENEKVTRNPHTDPDHRQKLITSKGSPLVHAYTKFDWRPLKGRPLSMPIQSLIDVRFRVRQLSCLQNDRQNYRQNRWHLSSGLAEVVTTTSPKPISDSLLLSNSISRVRLWRRGWKSPFFRIFAHSILVWSPRKG